MQSGLCVYAKDIWSCQVTHFNSYQSVRIDPSLEKPVQIQPCSQTDYSYQDFLLDTLNPVKFSNLNHFDLYQPFCLQMKWECAGTEALCHLALHLFHPPVLSHLHRFTDTYLHFLCCAHQFKHLPLCVWFLTLILYQNKEGVG